MSKNNKSLQQFIVYVNQNDKKNAKKLLDFISANLSLINQLDYKITFVTNPRGDPNKNTLVFLNESYFDDDIFNFIEEQCNRTIKNRQNVNNDPEKALEKFQQTIIDSGENDESEQDKIKRELSKKMKETNTNRKNSKPIKNQKETKIKADFSALRIDEESSDPRVKEMEKRLQEENFNYGGEINYKAEDIDD